MLGIPVEMARDPRTGSYIGRLYLMGRTAGISENQYHAALKFLNLRNRFQKAVQSSGAHYDPKSLASVGIVVDEEKAFKETTEFYKFVQDEITKEQTIVRGNLRAALQYVIIEDGEFPHLLNDVRTVCNVLHRCFNPPKSRG